MGPLGTGGGLYSGASVPDPTSVNATSVTFGGNTAGSGQGGGIYTTGNSVFKNLTIKDNTNGTFQRRNFVTTHLGNSVLDNRDRVSSIVTAAGFRSFLTETIYPRTTVARWNRKGIPAQLGPRVINANGINQTRYYPPLAGSPLINAAAGCPTLDQRGAARPDACDIGAVEYGGLAWFTFLP